MNHTIRELNTARRAMAVDDAHPKSIHTNESAQYLADMLLELRNMAKANNLKTLQGILEIAYYEAYSAANKIAIPEGEIERLQNLGQDARKADVS